MSMNQVAVRQEVATVRQTLNQMRPQLEMALPQHINADRMIRVVLTAVQQNPKLLECDRTSFLSAVMTGAQLGLLCDGVLGQGYLVPFRNKVQFIPGYKGLLTLARNSGEVSSIQAQPVYEADVFEYQFGLNERLDHIPARGNRGEITHFYAIARFKDGGHYWDVMSREQVDAIRDRSSGYLAAKRYAKNGVIDSPWVDHYDEMGRKTVIRRIAKYLPMDVQKAAFIAAAYDTGTNVTIDGEGILQIEGQSFAADAIEGENDESAADEPAKEDLGSDALDAFAEGDETQHQLGD